MGTTALTNSLGVGVTVSIDNASIITLVEYMVVGLVFVMMVYFFMRTIFK